MENMTTSKGKNRLLFLILLIFLGAIFTLIYLALNGNSDQIYTDIIVEWTAIYSSNKSIERVLLFMLIFFGMAAYAIFFLVSKWKWNDDEITTLNSLPGEQKPLDFLCALVAISVVTLLIWNTSYPMIIAAIFYTIIVFVIDAESVCMGISIFYLSIYTFIGIYRLYVFTGGEKSCTTMMIVVAAFSVSLFPLITKNRRKLLPKLGLLENIIIPFALLVYLSDKYLWKDNYVCIDVPASVRLIIFLFVLLFILEAIYVLIKKWNIAEKADEIITFGSCVTIMAFNRFSGTGVIMPADNHHPFENIIGFSQVFRLGQTPFKNYIPVSGMYSIVQGFIFDVFGGGRFANYHVTNNLFYLFVILLIILLLRQHLNKIYVLLLSIIFVIPDYNRTAFMLPIMLLLTWPVLIERKNMWLTLWFLTSLLQGLYYPLYGAATCLAFLPLGIWQIVSFAKSGELKKSIKKIKFWVGWILCGILLLLCAGFLTGTLKHMLAMSGQSILADGLSRFGQAIPNNFFSYLGNENFSIRIALYLIVTWMIPTSFVWISFALAIKLAGISFNNGKWKIDNTKIGCIISSAVIMPIISYTFTFIRLDINSIYARSWTVLLCGMVLILIFTWNYVTDKISRILLISVMVFIPAVANTSGIFSIGENSKLNAYYTVPDEYVYVRNDNIKKLGTGFIKQSMYDDLTTTYLNFPWKYRIFSYMGKPIRFGDYYLLNLKGDGAMELSTIKSFSATKEAIDIGRNNKTIFGISGDPYKNYYLYHWLLASGEYVYNTDTMEFIPNNGGYTLDEIKRQNKDIAIAWNNMSLGKVASSWGSSMKSLENIFTDKEIPHKIENNGSKNIINFTPFDGDEADFMYLEFANMDNQYEYTLYGSSGEKPQEATDWLAKYLMKKNYNPGMTVQLEWQDDNGENHTMKCAMSKGKLLIPLGAGLKWLFNQHDYVTVSVYQDGEEITSPQISKVRMLKLREAS